MKILISVCNAHPRFTVLFGAIIGLLAFIPRWSTSTPKENCWTESSFVGPMPITDTVIEHVIFTDEEAQEILSTIVEENWYRKYPELGVFSFDGKLQYCAWNQKTGAVYENRCWCKEDEYRRAHNLPTLATKPKKVSGEGFGGKKVYYGSEAIKRAKRLAYVARFKETAQREMKKYGIPASVTLAQGILESNAGESLLAVKNNNHFGIKCFSKSCRKGHCTNYTDDSHKDFFRKYNSAWESFRGHSHLLQAARYKPLYKLSPYDYKGWAKGLKAAGYATDKYYAEKLINLIEELNLHQYDLIGQKLK